MGLWGLKSQTLQNFESLKSLNTKQNRSLYMNGNKQRSTLNAELPVGDRKFQ